MTASASQLSADDKKKLTELFYSRDNELNIKPEHWISGDDSCDSFCRECAVKEIESLRKEFPDLEFELDGGFGSESDKIYWCKTCSVLLDGLLTEEGAIEELDHFIEYGFDASKKEDLHSMKLVMTCFSWDFNHPKIKKVCEQIKKEGL